ncbi:hypothetical protein AB0420_07440 [Streptomyces caelestis]|uniref:hypothetical protein n=1 Tax=Streptomyces TaxID=1883 RepID=UPI0018FE9034|nr:hypothetical protein [Streptomyces sp. XY152]
MPIDDARPVTRSAENEKASSGTGLAPWSYKPGHRSRFFHHTRTHHGRRNEPKSLTWRDYRALTRRAHQ